MRIKVREIDNSLVFIGKGESNHWVVMDGPEKFKGENAGTRPLELMLISLAGCTAADVASILNKMKVSYHRFWIEAEASRKTEHPKVFKSIHLKYYFVKLPGISVDEDKLKKAIELSQDKYCSASAMLRQVAELTYSYELIEYDG